MTIDDLKQLLGTDETVLELVQLNEGELALRIANSDKAPLVKIEFNEELRKMLGDQMAVVVHHMIQAAIFGVMEQQVNRWQAQVVDQKPQYYS